MPESSGETSPRLRFAPVLGWGIVLLGIALRARLYFAARSLRRDESSLALNLLGRSVRGLLGPLDREQGAPLGFLLLEKASIALFGDGELALRLVPFLAGMAVLPLMFLVARRLLSPMAAVVAVGIVAIGEPAVFYATELKQYSLDTATALALLLIALGTREARPIRLVGLGLAGVVAIWVSHPAVFVLGGIGATLLFADARENRWRSFALHGTLGLAWGISFLANDLVFLRHLRGNPRLLGFWAGSFAPFPPRSVADLRWYLSTAFEVFRDPGGLAATGLATLAFVVGVASLWRKDRKGLGMLLMPLALTLLASALRKYPFSGRLMLFGAPMLSVVVAEGLDAVFRFADRRGARLAVAWSILLFAEPALGALRTLVRPPEGEELHGVLRHVADRQRAGDTVYVYHGAEPAFTYYRERKGDPIRVGESRGKGQVWGIGDHTPHPGPPPQGGREEEKARRSDSLPPSPLVREGRGGGSRNEGTTRPSSGEALLILGVHGRDDWSAYPKDLKQLAGRRRVWVLFSHVVKVSGVDEERFLLFFLDRMGTRRDEIHGFGASAYLYDLSSGSAGEG